MEDEFPTKIVILTCQQSECENYGIELELVVPEDCVNFFCGPCGNQVDALVSGSD